MKITHSWLKHYGNIQETPEKIGEILTDLGIEVEDISSTLSDFSGVVVGNVLSVEKHPDADKLSICKVDINKEEPLQIVCGAPNVCAGRKIPVALDGATLPFGKLKCRKIRGIFSEGMICSEEELGFAEQSDGIWLLEDNFETGKEFRSYFEEDSIYDLSVGPNRPDCLGLRGILRELSQILPVENKLEKLPSLPEKAMHNYQIRIEDNEGCPRYLGALFSGVTIKESPAWLREALHNLGQRSINNIVDITNYLMLLTGHPMHAFDADKIAGNTIIIRKAAQGEKLTTLDSVEREFDSSDILICDAERSLAVAGVIGGEDSEISDDTTNLFLEIGYFDPISVRKTAKKQKLHTEASHRFERGMSPDSLPFVLHHTAALIMELANGEYEGKSDVIAKEMKMDAIHFPLNLCQRILGMTPELDRLQRIFETLGCSVERTSDSHWGITPPGFRPDLERPIDLVEEFARIHGYNNFPFESPKISLEYKADTLREKLMKKIQDYMVGEGFRECITYSFAKEESENSIALKNPLAEDMGQLRTSIKDKLIECAIHNLKKQNQSLSLFETGKVFFQDTPGEYREETHLCVLLCNNQEQNWKNKNQPADYFEMKGILAGLEQSLKTGLQIKDCRELPTYMDKKSTQSIMYRGKPAGFLGLVNPALLKKEKIFYPMAVLELDLTTLLTVEPKTIRFNEIPGIPASERQLALLTPANVTAEEILTRIQKQKIKHLESMDIFDVYTGKGIPENMKSVGVSLIFRGTEKTLSEEEMGGYVEKILADLDKQLKITLRP